MLSLVFSKYYIGRYLLIAHYFVQYILSKFLLFSNIKKKKKKKKKINSSTLILLS